MALTFTKPLMSSPPIELTPGTPYKSTGHIYAGAKSKTLLARYKKEQGIARMDLAIDYGFLELLTKPMSRGLTWLGKMTGNFGVAIILMTLLLKIVLFPLNNKSYSSMAKMKLLQPKIKKMQKRYGDDRMKIAARNDGAVPQRKRQPCGWLSADDPANVHFLRPV